MPNTCRGVGDGEPSESGANGTGSGRSVEPAQAANAGRAAETEAASGPNRAPLASRTSTAPPSRIRQTRSLTVATRMEVLLVGPDPALFGHRRRYRDCGFH